MVSQQNLEIKIVLLINTNEYIFKTTNKKKFQYKTWRT